MAEINTIIKNARDVLVGKIPDPKAQVEQITIALMYKFMDAKDLESIEFGGEASFFVDDLKDYSYHKIMATSNNTKKLDMYRKGLELLGESLKLPDVFRTIFKNAYLPYNDPATAGLFLKELDQIPTDNTELLGTAFEDLLSIMGSQGDAGQFRTPRHIIDFMADVIKPKKSETILDPACGTAGFLVSAFSYINENSSLTIDDKEKMKANFRGYDISPDMVRLAKVNLFLHGFKDPKIDEYDTLTFKDYWKEKFDVILANPPFMTPKGGINPHELFSIKANRSEVLFVDYILNHLKKNGRAAVIVPEGIVFQSQNAYKTLRKELVEEGLYAVVSLPSGVFNPYSGVKTSILLMDKSIARATDHILFVKLQNDGYDLGAQRRPTPEKNELPYALEVLESYKKAISKGQDVTELVKEDDFKILVSKERISENGEYSLVGDRYKQAVVHNSSYPMVVLGDVCVINPKKSEIQDENSNTEVSFVPMATLSEHHAHFVPQEMRMLQDVYSGYTYFKNDDVLLAKVTPCFENGKAGIAKNLKNTIGFGSSEFYVLRSKGTILPELLYHYIHGDNFVKSGKENMSGTGGLKRLTKNFLTNFEVPLPPLHIQEQIVAEIEGYQKIVDGAKQIIDNYKPSIRLDPKWEMVKLGDVCALNPKKSEVKELDENTEVSFVPMAVVDENSTHFSASEFKPLKDVYSGYTYFRENDVILAKVTPCFENGKAGIARGLKNSIGFGSSEFHVLRASDRILPEIIYFYIHSNNFINLGKENMAGTGGLKRLTKEFILNYPILLPPVEEQKQIVTMIELEQVAVNGAKALMQIFEQKIKDKISEVWGE